MRGLDTDEWAHASLRVPLEKGLSVCKWIAARRGRQHGEPD